jgi:hypothetical protein
MLVACFWLPASIFWMPAADLRLMPAAAQRLCAKSKAQSVLGKDQYQLESPAASSKNPVFRTRAG